MPPLVAFAHEDLDERPGELLLLPRRGRLACAQAHDDVFPLGRLARVKRDILHDSVTLVEDAEDGHALRHRGDAGLAAARGCALLGGDLIALLAAAAARRKSERRDEPDQPRAHAYSGIHGS
jgi:hypothetical protein